MIKAVFLDYTGTMVREDDPYTMGLLKRFITNSDVKDPKQVMAIVWGMIKQIEKEYYGDRFVMKDEMVDMILQYCVEHHGLKDNLEELHKQWADSWVYAPLFDDVKPFMENCSLPVFVITNDDLKYIEQSMAEKELHPTGIISAEMVRACKPHRAILDEALRVAGVSAEEAVLIGDSETSDVACALEAGVTPILLDRTGKKDRQDIRVIHSLAELEF